MDQSRRSLSTADLAVAGDETRGRGHEEIVGRSAREAAETFVRNDVGAPGAADAPPAQGMPARRDAPEARRHEPEPAMLFPHDETDRFRTAWSDIQTAFVDSPRESVQRADALIAEAMQRLAETFAHERSTLEQQWDRGDDVTTEDLRVVLQRYRSFFDRLLSV